MEEQILKILDDNGYDNDYMEAKDAAIEITTHVRKFHDWLTQDNTPDAFEKNYHHWRTNIKENNE